MLFEEVLAILRSGRRTGRYAGVARSDWQAVLILTGEGLMLQWRSGVRSLWAPTQDDLLTNDWQVR